MIELVKNDTKLVIILVGLPARGKSYISKKISRYFNWVGYTSKIFNVGNYRRNYFENTFNDNNFFDSQNLEARKLRDSFAMHVLEDLIKWINNSENKTIAIFDATNTTKCRRKMLQDRLNKEDCQIIYVESICDNDEIIERNMKMKLENKDYKNIPFDLALEDFKKRLLHYKKVYETIDNNENFSYIKITNVQRSFQVHKINEPLKYELCNFLMNININSGKFYLTRHGQSMDNKDCRIGGNSRLTEMGKKYSEKLFTHIYNCDDEIKTIFTSTFKRTIETGKPFSKKYKIINKKLLDEINAGICDKMTYKEIDLIYPKISEDRKKDKFNFRYPYGESYSDIINRIKYFILEIERMDESVLIVTHTAVLRCILGYFMDVPLKDIPYIDVPLHNIIKLVPISSNYKKEEKKLI